MEIRIQPHALQGEIPAIPSKSAAHRALICAALADRETEIYCPSLSKDIQATAACLAALGAQLCYHDGCYRVTPLEEVTNDPVLDCGESGSTLRFLLPVVCALGGSAKIKMHGRLPQRPLSPLWEELIAHGAQLCYERADVLSVSGRLSAGDYRIAADVSSQFISGLLFALPLLRRDSSLTLTGQIESAGYIRMTREAQRLFGLELPFDGRSFQIPAGSRYYSPGQARIEGDWSNAAFWLVASALSGDSIRVMGLNEESSQGDRAVCEVMARIRQGNAVIDARDIPDLVPVLAVLAAATEGTTEFVNAGRLRIKESDRIAAVCRMIHALGGDCTEQQEGLTIRGKKRLSGGTVDGENDHRIVMSAAVAAIVCEKQIEILGAQAAEKSYPAFFEDYQKLGGILL